MERLKNMSLRRSFFLLTLCGLLAALILTALLWKGCQAVSSQYPSGGVMVDSNGVIQPLPAPTPEQMRMRAAVDPSPCCWRGRSGSRPMTWISPSPTSPLTNWGKSARHLKT